MPLTFGSMFFSGHRLPQHFIIHTMHTIHTIAGLAWYVWCELAELKLKCRRRRDAGTRHRDWARARGRGRLSGGLSLGLPVRLRLALGLGEERIGGGCTSSRGALRRHAEGVLALPAAARRPLAGGGVAGRLPNSKSE